MWISSVELPSLERVAPKYLKLLTSSNSERGWPKETWRGTTESTSRTEAYYSRQPPEQQQTEPDEDWVWLFDCGEGSQIQLMKSSVKPGKVSKIFISHLHGDHLFGLPGLLCTVSQNNQRSEPVEIYGPLGLRAYLQTTLGVSHSEMGFTFTVHELVPVVQQLPPDIWEIEKTANSLPHPNEVPGKRIECDDNLVWNVFSDKDFVVQAVWVKHRVPSFAYVVKENDRPGKLDANKLKSLGVPAGPLYGKLKSGEVVHLADGTQIKPKDVMGPPQAGYVIAIGGDSSDSSELLKIACGAHVLIHEATLENAMEELCIQKGHSTPRMAGLLAKQLGVKQLILTHFSQRYKPLSCNTEPGEASVRILLQEAQEAFGSNGVICAEDLVTFSLPRLETG